MTLPPYRVLRLNPVWNLTVLTLGAALIALSAQSIIGHQGFLSGGVMGMGLLIWYLTDMWSAPIWYLLLNLPLLLFSWFKVSRRFVVYSLYGTLAVFLWGLLLQQYTIHLESPLYAAILGGVLMGAGGGIMLHTLGSSGGLDLVAVYLNQKWNIPIGRFSFAFNAMLFMCSVSAISLDLVITSFIQVFMSSAATDYVLRLFNQRKMVFIVTTRGQEICTELLKLNGRATLLPAYGGYSHESKEVVMTVTSNFFIRSLEDIVFTLDPHALFAVDTTFYVSGAQYPRESK